MVSMFSNLGNELEAELVGDLLQRTYATLKADADLVQLRKSRELKPIAFLTLALQSKVNSSNLCSSVKGD